MIKNRDYFVLPVSNTSLESSAHVITDLLGGSYLQHYLTNNAKPFRETQAAYLASYDRYLHSKNYRYILECKGEDE